MNFIYIQIKLKLFNLIKVVNQLNLNNVDLS